MKKLLNNQTRQREVFLRVTLFGEKGATGSYDYQICIKMQQIIFVAETFLGKYFISKSLSAYF